MEKNKTYKKKRRIYIIKEKKTICVKNNIIVEKGNHISYNKHVIYKLYWGELFWL